jgi:DNA-binding CsgD family transcriptional regulator
VATRLTDGYEASVPLLRHTLDRFRNQAEGDGGVRWFWLAWILASELWDDALWDELTSSAVRVARDSGSLWQLPMALVYRAGVLVHAGEFDLATALRDEADAIAAATGYAPFGYASGLLVMWRGDEPKVREQFGWAIPNATARGEGRALGQFAQISAILYNGLGRYEEAMAAARQACEYEDLGVRGFALVELIEAAVRCSDHAAAAEALRELEHRSLPAGTEWALGMLARSRALLSAGSDADALYVEAIERLERTCIVVHLARAHLIYGEWLRREQRRREARDQLRVAYERFDGMGADAFAERARRELVATGETARKRTVAAPDLLTPHEAQIARMAAAGRTNPEIGSELFISSKTVEYHLRKVFTKLGVASRRELRKALPLSP